MSAVVRSMCLAGVSDMKKIFLYMSLSIMVCCSALSVSVAEAASPANGKQIRYFSGSNRIRQITWWKNRYLVRRKTYDINGQLFGDNIYRKGQLVIERRYHSNGRLKSVWTRRSGQKKIYTADGALKRSMPYRTLDSRAAISSHRKKRQ